MFEKLINTHKSQLDEEIVSEMMQPLIKAVPDWFKFEVGFYFKWDTSPSVFLGPGMFIAYEENKQHNFYTHEGYIPGIWMMFFYKGEWCRKQLEADDFKNIEPI